MRRAVMRVNRASNESSASHSIHLHHFIAVMLDDLDCNLTGLGFVERITLGRVERRPRGFVNLIGVLSDCALVQITLRVLVNDRSLSSRVNAFILTVV